MIFRIARNLAERAGDAASARAAGPVLTIVHIENCNLTSLRVADTLEHEYEYFPQRRRY
jgi:hypothetical protein